MPNLSKGKHALHLVSCSSALDNLSFQPAWKSGNPYAWNLIIDISTAGRVIRTTTASWNQGRGNRWLHSLLLLFRYSALNGLILIYVSDSWTRTTNCTENFSLHFVLSDLSAACSFLALWKRNMLKVSSSKEEVEFLFGFFFFFFNTVSPCVGQNSHRHQSNLPSGLHATWASSDQTSALQMHGHQQSQMHSGDWVGDVCLCYEMWWSESTHWGFVHFSKPGRTFLWPK